MTSLTPERVAAARIAAAAGRPVAPLARQWGVSVSSLRQAVRGLTWRTLTDPAPVTAESPAARHRRLTAAQVAAARRHVRAGTRTIAGLAAEFGCADSTLDGAVYGRTWRGVTDPPPLPPRNQGLRRPGASKLTPAVVGHARRRYLDGVPGSAIAAECGVGLSTVLSAIHGITWGAVTDPPPVPVGNAGWRTDADAVAAAWKMRAAGETLGAIAEELGVSAPTVSRWCTERPRVT